MRLKELQRLIESLIAADRFRGDAPVTFKAGINAVEYNARKIGMETVNGIVVARIS